MSQYQKMELFRRKMMKKAQVDNFQEEMCRAIVFTSMESGNSVEEIMHWPIRRFYVVLENINKINEKKYGEAESSLKARTLR